MRPRFRASSFVSRQSARQNPTEFDFPRPCIIPRVVGVSGASRAGGHPLSATAPRLPDADHTALPRLVKHTALPFVKLTSVRRAMRSRAERRRG